MLQQQAQWLKNRLETMGPAEILSRLADVGRYIALWISLPRVQTLAERALENADSLPKVPDLNLHLVGISQAVRGRVITHANQWLQHRASFFALHETPLGATIEWHRNYSSGVLSPLKYSGLLNHRDVAAVDNVKYIWELNRLQHLILLASAAVWTGNKTYSEEIERQLLSWRTQNPFMKGLNWKSPLEAGIRLISWALVSSLLPSLNGTRGFFWGELRETIYQHQYFIRKFHSKHSSANNHLIGEMAGLYVGAVVWPWYKESSSWQSFARRTLIQEITRQVETDGVSKEQATEYQLLILEFFLLAGALGQAIGAPFPPEYWDRLARMMTFVLAISDRAGHLPMFGDGDSGQVVWLPETTPERARTLGRIGPLGDRPTMGSDFRTVFLLWGQAPEKLPLGAVPTSKQGLQVFSRGGYCVLVSGRDSDDEMKVVFDVGPLGLPPLYAHGHADALSFWLSYGGHEFLIDPGTFCYHANPLWRAYFRGTAAHSTVRVDGVDQSIPAGIFLWRHAAHCQAERVADNDEFVEVEGFHDGYQRLADPVLHRRRIRLYKNSPMIVIVDRLECQSTHDIEMFLHFSETCQVQAAGPGAFQVSNGNKRLGIRLDTQLQPELYRGSENPICGWVSRTFDVKKPTFTLVARASVNGSRQFFSEIVPV